MFSVNLSLEHKEQNLPLPCIRVVQDADIPKGKAMTSEVEVYEVMSFLKQADREMLYALHLDSKLRIIAMELISVGYLSETVIHPREVFKGAILNNSAFIILVHNHPSGDVKPSKFDIKITKKVMKVGDFLGIPVLDHVIIGDGSMSILQYLKGKGKNTMKEDFINISCLKYKAENLIKKVLQEDMSIYVLRKKIPVAVILPYDDYKDLMQLLG